jgi:hypothetical protein
MLVKMRYAFLAAALATALCALPAMAQNPGAGGGGGGRGGPGGGFGRQQFEDTLKKELGTSDDEFKAIQPKIQKVRDLQQQLRGNMRAMFGGGRGGRGGGGGAAGGAAAPAATDQPQSPVEQKATDLKTALDNKDAKPEDIKAKLDALRDARTKTKEELTVAQTDLKGLLTQRQEAVLVEFGILE